METTTTTTEAATTIMDTAQSACTNPNMPLNKFIHCIVSAIQYLISLFKKS